MMVLKMRMREAATEYSGRIQRGFTTVVVLALGLCSTLVIAQTVTIKSNPFNFPGKKPGALNYPDLPKEIVERIAGRKRQNAATSTAKIDSSLSQDWALMNIGFFEVFNPMVQPIRGNVQPCSPDVVVAVIDTGIDYTHKELIDSVWVNPGESGAWEPPPALKNKIACRDRGCNGVDDDGNGFVDDVVGWDFVHDIPLPFDTHGHGTHIAGIISGGSANGVGTTGVCPRVGIMPLKYYDNSGAGYNNLNNTVRAIHYAVQNGAQIINYSGGGADPAPAERIAIEEARKRGILFIAAAGNDGHNNDQTPYFPQSYPLDNIVGVASLNRQNQLLPSSNFGKSVDIAAPGLGILSTLPEGRLGTMSGTSQATAFVTGAAALLASQLKAQGIPFDYKKIKQWINAGAKPMKGNEKKAFVASGVLSVSQSLQVVRDDMKKSSQPSQQAPELALKPVPTQPIQ